MKTMLVSMGAALVAAMAAQAASTVSDVTVSFGAESREVRVGYTLTGDPAIVTVAFRKDGERIGGERYWNVAGDVNIVVKPGGGRSISWRPELLWPDQKLDAACVTAEVTAWSLDAPPQYAVVWLKEKRAVKYYASEDTLPYGGHTNALYMTTLLAMSRIPAKGVTWLMGSPETEPGHNRGLDETQHYVTFTNDYYVGVFPVTQGQLTAVGIGNKSGYSYPAPAVKFTYNQIRGTPGADEDIDWPRTGSAVATTSVLGKFRARTGLAFDIPTEAQWEFAARAGSPTAFPNNLTIASDANDVRDENLSKIGFYKKDDGGRHGVGGRAKNAWGLYDVCGTIWEYCRDWVSTTDPIGTAEVVDPPGLQSGTVRSRRGGCYDNQPWAARCAFRTSNSPTDENMLISFRFCLPLSEVVGK